MSALIRKTFLSVLTFGLLFVSLFGVIITVPTFAQAVPSSSTLCNSSCPVIATPPTTTNRNDLAAFILNVARFITFLGGAVAVLFLVYGGILYITDNGSGDSAKKGKAILISAVTGLVVVIVAYTAVGLISGLVQGNLFASS
jgi:hypothetical protein